MKIRSAVPENGCLIFMHYRGGRKKNKKNICKTHTHSRPLAARMRKLRKRKASVRWVSRMLTEEQKQIRIDVCTDLLSHLQAELQEHQPVGQHESDDDVIQSDEDFPRRHYNLSP